MRLHDRDDRPEPERQRHEEEVVDRRRRELDAREVDRCRGDRDHVSGTGLDSAERLRAMYYPLVSRA